MDNHPPLHATFQTDLAEVLYTMFLQLWHQAATLNAADPLSKVAVGLRTMEGWSESQLQEMVYSRLQSRMAAGDTATVNRYFELFCLHRARTLQRRMQRNNHKTFTRFKRCNWHGFVRSLLQRLATAVELHTATFYNGGAGAASGKSPRAFLQDEIQLFLDRGILQTAQVEAFRPPPRAPKTAELRAPPPAAAPPAATPSIVTGFKGHGVDQLRSLGTYISPDDSASQVAARMVVGMMAGAAGTIAAATAVPESVAEPVAEPVAESVAEPVAEPAAAPTIAPDHADDDACTTVSHHSTLAPGSTPNSINVTRDVQAMDSKSVVSVATRATAFPVLPLQ
jgi:hypothetical protein